VGGRGRAAEDGLKKLGEGQGKEMEGEGGGSLTGPPGTGERRRVSFGSRCVRLQNVLLVASEVQVKPSYVTEPLVGQVRW